MNSPVSPRGGKLSAGILGCLCCLGSLSALNASETAIPRGSLNVDRDLVRVGTRSQLNWKIEYPSAPPVDVTPTGTIIPKSDLKMRVRVLGVAFQSGSTLLPLEAYWSKNGAPWTRYFYGNASQVKASDVLIDSMVKANDRIDFGGRGWSGSSWLPYHHTRTDDRYVTVLQNGDSAPSYAPAYNQGEIVSFLAPYLDAGGKIRIGSRDLIILWEASTASPGTTYFDMQDLVVLVSFE